MNKGWSYLHNTFISVTEDSYRTCRKIGDYSLNALQVQSGEPFFGELYTRLLPYVTNFNAQYVIWKQQLGLQKSKTSTLANNLKVLSGEKIAYWDVNIQTVFPQGSEQYIALLPNRRAPFQSGSQEDRIAAVEALSGALVGIQQLATIRANVDAFKGQLVASFNEQKANLSATNVNSTAVEIARVAVCTELYGILGTLMNHFRTNPTAADNYFDTESIRNTEQTLYKSNINGGELKLALTHTFGADEEVRIVNKGGTELRFALCTEANDALAEPWASIAPMSEIVVAAKELGNVATQRYLKAENLSHSEEGRYYIMLL